MLIVVVVSCSVHSTLRFTFLKLWQTDYSDNNINNIMGKYFNCYCCYFCVFGVFLWEGRDKAEASLWWRRGEKMFINIVKFAIWSFHWLICRIYEEFTNKKSLWFWLKPYNSFDYVTTVLKTYNSFKTVQFSPSLSSVIYGRGQ